MKLVAVTLATFLATTGIARARPNPEHVDDVPGEDDQLYSCNEHKAAVVITFKPETEVKDLISWVMGFTCKKFVYNARDVANRKVTVIAPTKMTPSEGYRLFLVALSTAGLTVVPKGPVLRVVESANAKRESLPIYKKELPDSTDQVVRYVVRPAYATAEVLKTAFTALKSDAGDILVVGSLLVVTDFGSHVRDMLSLATLIDVPGGSDGIYTIPVRHADAAKLAEKITGILGLGTAPPAPTAPTAKVGEPAATTTVATPSKILVDERTNTLVVASSEAGYRRVQALVERLDISLDMEDGSAVHVYQLGSAIAEELALTLNNSITQGTAKPGAKPAGTPAAGTPAAKAPTESIGAALEGPVKVIGDKPTNSLIVLSSGRDFIAMKDIIKQLDQPRRQVYIEAMILEVAVSDGLDLGTASHGAVPVSSSNSLVVGGVQTGNLKTLTLGTEAGAASLSSVSGLVTGLIGSSLAGSSSFLGTSIPSYAVLFNALATESNTNILSAPSIIALDNEEAKYKVGTSVPYKKGLSFPTTSGNSPFNSAGVNIEHIDLVLELNIKPHISTNDSVLLEIKHSSKDLADKDAELGPSWTTRDLETRVLVRDQHTVVIGGLMQTREIESKSKVPLLGDIPILGHLFKYTTKVKKKTNLLILLTPYIIKDQVDLENIRERKARQHDEFTRSFSSLAKTSYVPDIDYRRKRGLLEEINRSLADVEQDTATRKSISGQKTVEPGLIEAPRK